MNFSNSRSGFNSFYKNMSKNKYSFNMFNSAFNSKKSMINFSNNYTYSSLINLSRQISLVQIGALVRFSPLMAIAENKGIDDMDLNNETVLIQNIRNIFLNELCITKTGI